MRVRNIINPHESSVICLDHLTDIQTDDGELMDIIQLNTKPETVRIELYSEIPGAIGVDELITGQIVKGINHENIQWDDSLLNKLHNFLLQVHDIHDKTHRRIAPQLVQIGQHAVNQFLTHKQHYLNHCRVKITDQPL